MSDHDPVAHGKDGPEQVAPVGDDTTTEGEADPSARSPWFWPLIGAIVVVVALGAVVLALGLSSTTTPTGTSAPGAPPAAGSAGPGGTAVKGTTASTPAHGGSATAARTRRSAGGGTGGTARSGSTGTNATSAPTTTTTTTLPPVRMEAWVYVAASSHTQLADDVLAVAQAVQGLSTPTTTAPTTTTTPTDTVPPPDPVDTSGANLPASPYVFNLANACSSLKLDLAQATRLPAAPLSAIDQDWLGLLSGFGQVEQACSQALAGSNPGFVPSWPSMSANVTALSATLVSDLNHAGYCFPADGCPPPFTVP